jgi:hypothetical protein
MCAISPGESRARWHLDLGDRFNSPFDGHDLPAPRPFRARVSAARTTRLVGDLAKQVLAALKTQDSATLASLVHPRRGLQISLYRFISLEEEPVLTAEKLTTLFSTRQRIFWRTLDATGDPIRVSIQQYLRKYIYSRDFLRAPQVGYNNLLSGGTTMVSNIDSFYPEALFVTFHFPGEGEAWDSLHLAFEEWGGRWYLAGVIRDYWTI